MTKQQKIEELLDKLENLERELTTSTGKRTRAIALAGISFVKGEILRLYLMDGTRD